MPITSDPPSLAPTVPGETPTIAPMAPYAEDPLLHDYPPPAPTGQDLPSYEGGQDTPGMAGALGTRIRNWFQGDPWSAFMALVAGGFVLVILVIGLLRSC